MNAPPLRALMERRILVNYRVDADVLAAVVPRPFRPLIVDGHGIAGVCLVRLTGIRPPGVPAALGLRAENAAHRVAVEWDSAEGPVTGVYVPRRDTSSRLAAIAGGRLFPGWEHLARFRVEEGEGRYQVEVVSRDDAVRVRVAVTAADRVMPGSVFASLDEASDFFRGAPVAYAATPASDVFDGVELVTEGWSVRPLQVEAASSSFFDDPGRFPPGSVALDSAFLMAGLETTWHPRPSVLADAPDVGHRASR